MWEIWESRKAKKGIDKLPHHLLERWEFWKNVVTIQGPEGLKKIRGLRDHLLKGHWQGYRSSSLNEQWRIIYKIVKSELLIDVIEVNPHDYKKRG